MPTRRKLKVNNLILLLLSVVLLFAGLGFLVSKAINKKEEVAEVTPSSEVVATATPIPETRISFFFTGDALLHESVYTDAQNEDGTFNFDKQLHHIKDIVKNYDVAYYNQETILGGESLGYSGYPQFNSPTEFGDYMIEAGFNLISTATNHCLDRGTQGIQNSHDYFAKKEGVLMQGTNISQDEQDAIRSIEVKGIKIAFLSYTYGTNGIVPEADYLVNYFPGHEEEIIEKVKKADEENDIVFLAMHWGDEYSMQVNSQQRDFATQLVEAGADIIVGNHPHVIQPYESINGKPVFYAMGNLISSQLDEENLVGMIGGLDIVKKEDEVTIENVRCDLVWTTMKGVYPALRYNIEVIPFNKLTEDILPGYQDIYNKYKEVIGDDVHVGDV